MFSIDNVIYVHSSDEFVVFTSAVVEFNFHHYNGSNQMRFLSLFTLVSQGRPIYGNYATKSKVEKWKMKTHKRSDKISGKYFEIIELLKTKPCLLCSIHLLSLTLQLATRHVQCLVSLHFQNIHFKNENDLESHKSES